MWRATRVGRARQAALGVGARYATAASGDVDPGTWGYRQNNARRWFRAMAGGFEVVQGIAGNGRRADDL
jgi:hypothetical protein